MSEECCYMAEAYPDLDAVDTCSEHRHDEPTFTLALAMAMAMQDPDPSDEQVAWFLDDAAEVVDDFVPKPSSWTVTEPHLIDEPGLELAFTINGVDYVIQDNDSGGHVVCHPVSRATWDQWEREANEADKVAR